MSREIKWLGKPALQPGFNVDGTPYQEQGTLGQTRYQEYNPSTGAAIGSPLTQAEYDARSGLRPFTRVRVVSTQPLFEKHHIQLVFTTLNSPFLDLGWFYGPVAPYPGAPATTAAFRLFVCKQLSANLLLPLSGISVFVDGAQIGGAGLWKKWDFCSIGVPGYS